MQHRHNDIERLEDLDYSGSQLSTGALPAHLWARIARRPGRRRSRMQSRRLRREEELEFYGEAA